MMDNWFRKGCWFCSLQFNIAPTLIMMASHPQLLQPNSESVSSFPKRKRRFKIFDISTKPEPEKNHETIAISHRPQDASTLPQSNSRLAKQDRINTGFVQIPKKITLENDFYGDDDIDFVSHTIEIQGMCTVGSQKFGRSDQFSSEKVQPSFLVKNELLTINEASILFKSVSELKSSFYGIEQEANILAASVQDLKASVSEVVSDSQSATSQLRQLQQFLDKVKQEDHYYSQKLEQLSERIEGIELRQSLQTGISKDSPHQEELKVFIEEKGYRVDIDEDDDEFVVTQFLPASVIAEFIQMRKQKSQEEHLSEAKIQEQKRLDEAVKIFHPCLGIDPSKYGKLVGYISEQFPGRKPQDVNLDLVFRKGTVDLDTDWTGEQEDLQYKQYLLFIIRNSMNKTFGGFVSNYLIEGEVREDPHAFLFSLQDQLFKLKIKEQLSSEAYQSSKHYLVCFGSDLMISKDCLEEQSYCEWPSSYEGKGSESIAWLAGDFSFMIEHIQIYEVTLQ